MAYTNIDDPSAYFQTATYTGTGSTQSITNDGNSDLQPDLVWVKGRSHVTQNVVFDSSRGVNNRIITNLNISEDTGDNYGVVSAFNTDGFTVNPQTNLTNVGGDGYTYAAWQWKANAGSTSTNTSGTLTSTIQSDTTAGFCIATYTGNGTQGATYGHNLGVAPDIIFTKNLTSGSTDWSVDGSIGDMVYGTNKLVLNTNVALTADTNNVIGASSTLITVGNGANCNQNTSSHVAYLFAEKQGFSKFGKFTANGNSNGTFVYTGFKPAFLMWKISSGTGNWSILNTDNKNYNVADAYLSANLSNAETTATPVVDLLSNGFKDRYGLINGSTYIYMAFAENPFVTSTGIPTTAR